MCCQSLKKYKSSLGIREQFLIWQSNCSLQIRNGAPFRQQLCGLLQACDCENSISSTSWPFITGAKCNSDNAHISPHERLSQQVREHISKSLLTFDDFCRRVTKMLSADSCSLETAWKMSKQVHFFSVIFF